MKSFLLLGFAACALGFSLRANNNYDYFLFETEWKPTNCKFMTCPTAYKGESFNIHGLWPERTDGSYPTNCTDAPFDVSNSVEAEMNEYWESYNGNNAAFWLHEWQKHGTCVDPAESPDQYFSSTINLFLTVDPEQLLADKGIHPSNTESYPLTTFHEAFSTSVNIGCHCSNNVCYFQTLEMCVDKGLNLMNCPRKNSNCQSSIILPSS